MATSLGKRYLDRYVAGEVSAETLASVRDRGWVTTAEYDAAIAAAPVQ